MPYQFVDTIEHSSTETMPAEAMKINGEYIENQMDARYCTYRTLYTKGREMLSPEITSFETGVRDGTSLLSRRYPERVITVGFFLSAISNNYFRQAFNELNRILNVEDAELIFYDEQDKYFIGTPAGIEEEPEPGSNCIKAEFNIICNDPFKYSVKEYEAEQEADGTFVINYGGTYKGFPVLEADFYEESECGPDGSTPASLTGSGDCGYVAWFRPGDTDSDDAKIIQIGDPEEEEGETYEKSQTLFTQKWQGVSEWTSALNEIWSKNNGVTSGNEWVYKTGTPGFKIGDEHTLYYLCATSYGSDGGTDWHGPTVMRTLPPDAAGEVGATDFTARCNLKMCIDNSTNSNKQHGNFQFLIGDANGKVITGMHVLKNGDGTTATLRAFMGGCTIVKDLTIDLSYHNTHFGGNISDSNTTVKTCTFTKTGSKVDMNLGGTVWSFTDPSIENSVATTVSMVFGQHGSHPTLAFDGVYWCDFKKNNCTTWADIPNKFSANDVLVVDCKNGQIYLNDAPMPEFGVLGNNWEGFYLTPGINQIGFSYSDWCQNPPTSKIRYREVYL